MKGYSGRKAPAALGPALLPVLLLCCLFPPLAPAQIREERIETGRFGAEEPEPSPAAPDEADHYLKWLYLGLRSGPSLRLYTPAGAPPYTGGDTQSLSLDTAFQVSLQVLPFLSIQGEAVFTWDKASVWSYHFNANREIDRYTQDYSSLSLQFPLMVKLNLYPGNFRVSPFFGAYCLLPLGEIENTNSLDDRRQTVSSDSPPFGLLGGLNGALKLGPGSVFADLRYTADLGLAAAGGIETYRRSMVSLTFGYELGFFTKKGGAK
jgi:hypothetical protein